jgi:hypothetical protein
MLNKQKIPAGPILFNVACADVFASLTKQTAAAMRPDSKLMAHIASQPPVAAGKAPPFYISVNFMVPGSPGYHQLVYFQAPKHILGFYSPTYFKMARHYGYGCTPTTCYRQCFSNRYFVLVKIVHYQMSLMPSLPQQVSQHHHKMVNMVIVHLM